MNNQTVIVNASGLDVQIGRQIILKKAELTVFEGERVGLVGRNGAGKSTLLSILAGTLKPDDGILAFKRETQVAFLPQDLPLDPEKTVRENVLDGASYVLKMISRYEQMSHDNHEAMALEHTIAQHGGWTLDRRVDEAMTRLHLPPPDRSSANLSGGERRRVALCRTLVSLSDLLLLDEPTNHLDTEAIEWLEQFLSRYPGTCIMVTHDRYFLDRIADRILELTDGVIYSHPGNYTAYLTAKSDREEQDEAKEHKRQSFLRRELDWVRRGPKARTTKSKSRLDRYYSAESESGPNRELDVELILPVPPKLSARVVDFRELGLSLGGKTLFKDFSFSFSAATCIGVVGPNGVGKTSLIKVMIGELEPDSGELVIGNQTVFNYVDQHRVHLNDDNTVFNEINDGKDFIQFGGEEGGRVSTWTYLRRYLFAEERILTQVRCLSGGERSRLMLAKILKDGGNFLILDEPTNDLDLPTLRVLEEGLIRFAGCAMVVSHDRYFLNRVCTGILAFEGDGKVYYQEGDYDYYLQKKAERQPVASKPEPVASKVAKSAKTSSSDDKPKKLTWKDQKELDGMEEKINKAEAAVAEMETQFNDPDFYIKNGPKVKELIAELEHRRREVEKLYSRWHELSSQK
ncbi:MAG TPA: ABC transporter [Lentisphaeria bacterium]|nr:MAG: ABC transporter [Lentisphaerae bacterium GWF2_49_21]HBC89645.1 ABC transporter [Lentisphaeria bacterium]